MSNIYIQEPPTSGKVLIKTTAGEIECELWAKEAPKTCRNFIQLCLDKFYDKTPFHRLVPGFIIQCGENAEKADLIEPIKNEFHSRLRFMRRGLLGVATNEGSDNNMEFFFTLNATPELQNTHTIFGKVAGDTIYNLLKLGESETDSNERPLHPHKINKIKILHNPFDDIEPRTEHLTKKASDDSKKKQRKEGVKNFKLISFGEEAEQDETEVESLSKLTQPSAVAATVVESKSASRKREKDDDKRTPDEPVKRRKSTTSESRTPPHKSAKKAASHESSDDDDDDYEVSREKEKMTELERKKREIQDQIQNLKKEYRKDRRDKEKQPDSGEDAASSSKSSANGGSSNPAVRDYLGEKEKYKKCKINVKGASRENFTLQLLEKFKVKLSTSKSVSSGGSQHEESSEAVAAPAGEELSDDDESWMNHRLDFSESQIAVLAKDASTKEQDWYDIYDPRNPLNQRKRGGEGKGGDVKSQSHNKRR